MHIEIPVYDGFDDLDAFAPHEVLSHARWDARLVGVDGPGTITSAHGVRLTVEAGLGTPDAIIVPGGGWSDPGRPGARLEFERGVLPAQLRELAPSCRFVASVCTGAMLLAAAGLTDARPATTHHTAHQDLADTGAQVIAHARVVDDGDLITAAGVTSGLDLALHLLAREAGPEVARLVAEGIEYPLPGPDRVWTSAQTMPTR